MKLPLRALLPVLALLTAACAQLPARPALPVESAIPASAGGRLDQLVAPAEAAHPGASGFRLVSDGVESFALRAYTARLAVRSLDVQTYIWHQDTTGLFLAHALLAAADRGVHVRLLLDDIDARAEGYFLAALDAHPNIEVRLYNPLASRSGAVSMSLDFLRAFGRLNHRMHNKSWIADNRVAIVGGRNVGDEYFGASDEVNFVDLDFAMVGPVVAEASASFDRYWNAAAAYPVATLNPAAATAGALAKLRHRLGPAVEAASRSSYAAVLRDDAAVHRLLAHDWPMTWTAAYKFATDDPLKTKDKPESGTSVAATLRHAFLGTQHSLVIISPYFVPGREGAAWLADMAESGRSVRILTNSLAANDVAAVHGGYERYRRRLLRGGVQIWELKPDHEIRVPGKHHIGASSASLHTKALVIDDTEVFVGSFNIDPRSTSLNTEQGVLLTDPGLARQVERIFERQTDGSRSWQVTLADGELCWSDGRQQFHTEPLASTWRRFQAWLARILPVESLL